MKKLLITTCAIAQFGIAHTALSQDHHDHHYHHNHEEHYAPIGVMADHAHETGKWMASYRYSYMEMDGNRDGTNSVSNAEIAAQGFMIAPQDMTMEMHMFGAMYGFNDKLTIAGMLPYKKLTMDHTFVNGANSGKSFTMNSEGFGDASVRGIYTLYQNNHSTVTATAGITLPTGSIEKRDFNSVTNAHIKLPYPMQLGSGTFDLLPGITFSQNIGKFNLGSQLSATIRMGENSNHYTLGDEYKLTAWGSYQFNDVISTSLRLDGIKWDDIDGADPDHMNINMAPTFRTDLRSGERIDAIAGINLTVPSGTLKGHQFGLEFSTPIYQDLDGPQLETDYRLMVGWRKVF